MGEARPIFVVGYQRSGTTLLQSLLGAHSRIAAPPETHFIFRIADLADYYGDLGDDARLRRALHEALHPPVPLFDGCGFDEDVLYERARAGERSYRALLAVIMADFAERQGKARWSEKTPTQPARSVHGLFPDAQIVHIVRDPRDVVASSLEAPWTGMDAGQIAAAWKRFTLDNIRFGRALGPDAFLQVRYEDLTRDPEPVLRLICTFVGEEYEPHIVTDPSRRQATIADAAAPWQHRALTAVTPSQEGGWRSRMSRVDAARVAAVVGPMLPALGYPPARFSTRAIGHGVNAAVAPTRLPAAVERLRIHRLASDPAARYAEVQRYLRDRAATVVPG